MLCHEIGSNDMAWYLNLSNSTLVMDYIKGITEDRLFIQIILINIGSFYAGIISVFRIQHFGRICDLNY